MARCECPQCGQRLQMPEVLSPGQTLRCPKCKHPFRVAGEAMPFPQSQTVAQVASAAPAPVENAQGDPLQMLSQQLATAPRLAKRMPAPKGIGGWLVLPAIGLVVGPGLSILLLLGWARLLPILDPELKGDARFWALALLDGASIAATVAVAVLFFLKRRSAVPAIIGLMVASILISLVQLFLSSALFGGMDGQDIKPVIHATVYGAIWIPYFLVSKRVKETFVR